jgi:hypothetical protein
MGWIRGSASDYVLKSAALEAVEIAANHVQTETLKIAAEMIRTATLPFDYENDPTYKLAQKDFADMLYFVAIGEIDIALVRNLEADKKAREEN